MPLLALAMISLCTYSYFELEHHLPYPTLEEITSNYQFYVGKRISIFGTVTSATENACVISTDGSNFTVAPISTKVGDKAEVLGTLGENYRITTEKVVAYDRVSYYSIFLRSLVGAALLAFFFLKNWRFKIKRFKFVGRK